jgi:hypothetical protein
MATGADSAALLQAGRRRAVLFAAQVDVAALVQQKQGQAGEQQKSNDNFPHGSFSFQKKALAE